MKLVTTNKLNRLWKNGILPKLSEKLANTQVLTTTEQVQANTNAKNVTGAAVTKALINDLNTTNTNLNATNTKLGNIRVYVGTDKKLHFVNSAGADTVLNFSNTNLVTVGNFNLGRINLSGNTSDTASQTFTMPENCNKAIAVITNIQYASFNLAGASLNCNVSGNTITVSFDFESSSGTNTSRGAIVNGICYAYK